MEKEKKWKIGDFVTYKDPKDCYKKSYEFGGQFPEERKGQITSYENYNQTRECWAMSVTHNDSGANYSMLENEFEEFTNDISPIKESLEGRWIKALQDRPEGANALEGEYRKIKGENSAQYLLIDGYVASKCSIEKFWEIMPKEFHISNFNKGDIVDTSNKGWQCCSHVQHSVISEHYKNKVIKEKIWNDKLKEWWYLLNISSNWYTESSLSIASKQAEVIIPAHPVSVYKSGDIVVCIEGFDNRSNGSIYGGAGYIPNLCFKVKRSNQDSEGIRNAILWKTDTDNGVYEKAVRLATKEEENKFNEKGGSYYITEIPKQENSVDIEELLAYAKEHYTIGVTFSSIFSDNGEERKIVPWSETHDNSVKWAYLKSQKRIYNQNGLGKEGKEVLCSNPSIWKDGKWAPIIKEINIPEEHLIKEAIIKYPIGTKFINPSSKIEKMVSSINYKFSKDTNSSVRGITSGEGWVYINGKWAEIVPVTFTGIDRVYGFNTSRNDSIYMGGIDPYDNYGKQEWNFIKKEEDSFAVVLTQDLYSKKHQKKKEKIIIEHQLPILIKTNNNKRKLITI